MINDHVQFTPLIVIFVVAVVIITTIAIITTIIFTSQVGQLDAFLSQILVGSALFASNTLTLVVAGKLPRFCHRVLLVDIDVTVIIRVLVIAIVVIVFHKFQSPETLLAFGGELHQFQRKAFATITILLLTKKITMTTTTTILLTIIILGA